ncbi:MAG: choice-of-anchor tandem repeat GloVer-containing protein, partial [Bryobacteraceae bacterium]
MPEGALVIASNGVLYGTTQGGGAYGLGSVFELTKPAGDSWKETVLHSFSGSDGQYPESTLAFGSGGVLYGTTLGGNGVAGTIFQLSPPTTSGGAWALTVLHAFPYNSEDSQNFSPNGTVLIGTGGTLYATTQGPGSPDLG